MSTPNQQRQLPSSRWGAPLPSNTQSSAAVPSTAGGSAAGSHRGQLPRGYATHTANESSTETNSNNNFLRDQPRDRSAATTMGDARPSNSRGDEHRSRGNSIGGFVGREGGGGRWDRRDSWGEDRDRFARHDRGGGGGGNRRLCERELDSDWKCLEWRSSSQPGGGPRKQQQHHRDDASMDDRRRDDGNYYGPPSQHNDRSRSRDDDHNDGGRPSSRKKTRTCSTGDKDDRGPIQREWPPAFESSGASYVFDTRSGMFYEPSSNFFYDPKTKLYYSNKKQQYFQFVMGSKNKFQPIGGQQVSQSVSVEESNGAVVDKDAVEPMPNEGNAQKKTMPEARIDETRHEKAEVKPKIAISLKTPALPSKDNAAKKTLSEVAAIEKNKLIEQNMIARKEFSSSAPDTATASIPQSHKQHENDMDKWSERVKEMRSEDSPNASAAVVKEKQSATIASTPKIVKTASGQPICVLCKRKFANVEKLQQHEKLSALHKENQAKKAAAEAKSATSPKQETISEASYRDRTKERRLLYGDFAPHAASGNSSHADAFLAQVNNDMGEVKATEAIRPEETLGTSNVGNKLLQKLGWKSGDTLGRKQDEHGSQSNKGNGGVANSLKSDWERIESLAQGGGRAR